MKSLDRLLAKRYHSKLLKHSSYKIKLKAMQELFHEYGITFVVKDEWSFFQLEIAYESILNKRKFEDVYFSSYAMMHDYWNDLDYQERRHQMNVDIDRMRKELKSFPYQKEEIYIPIFDKRWNRIYREEIVMMEWKQYQRCIRQFEDLIQQNRYGILPFVYHFTSCVFVCGEDQHFVLYNPELNRLYSIKDFTLEKSLPFDPQKKEESTFEQIRNIANAFLRQDDIQCAKYIVDSQLIHDPMKKKLQRWIVKAEKKKRKNDK